MKTSNTNSGSKFKLRLIRILLLNYMYPSSFLINSKAKTSRFTSSVRRQKKIHHFWYLYPSIKNKICTSIREVKYENNSHSKKC